MNQSLVQRVWRTEFKNDKAPDAKHHQQLRKNGFKFHRWHKIDEKDFSKRVIFAELFLSLPVCPKDFFICTDEAYFHITLSVNKQNNRTWMDIND